MKSLAGQTAVYGLGELLPRAIGFLLLPLYAHHLSPADYGVLAVLDMTGAYFAIVVSAGFSSALIRFYHQRDEAAWKNRVFITCLSVALTLGAVGVSLALPLVGPLSELLFDGRRFAPYLLMILASVAIEVANGIVLTLFRVKEDPVWYLRDSLIRLALAVPMNVTFIAVLGMGILGFVLSNLLTAAALFLIVGLRFVWRHRARPDLALARELFRFAAPFIPTGLLETFIHQLGVLCLTLTGNLTLVGLYGVGQRIASLVAYAYSPIGAAWIPYMHKIARQPDATQVYARGTTWIALLLGGLVVGIAAFGSALLGLMTPEAYQGASAVLLPLAFGALFFALRPSARIGISLTGRTGRIPIATGVPALLGFPLTLALAHAHGAAGASVGVAATMAGVLLSTGALSQQLLAVPFEWSRLARIAAALLVCAAAGVALPAGRHALAAGVVLAYPLLLLALGVPSAEERRALSGWIGALRGREA